MRDNSQDAEHGSGVVLRSQPAALRAGGGIRHNLTGRLGGKQHKEDDVATWGPGNFDNDAARDHLFEMAHGLA